MDKKDIMRTLLFPEFVKNSCLIEKAKKECIDFDRLYSNAKLDLMLHVVCLENDGKTFQKIILKGRYDDKQRGTKTDTGWRI